VLDGLFYSGVVVTEADADSRLFQLLSAKINPSLDIHFVNADNKQTVPKVLAPYKRLGVRCAGIVDIDVLNNAGEFKKQLEAADIVAQLDEAMIARQRIDDELNSIPTADRLKKAATQINEIKKLLDEALTGHQPAEHEKVLDKLRRDLERVKADTSAWQFAKKCGVSVLKNTRADFEKIYKMCSEVGLFISPWGELEASLIELGIVWQSDKRTWINQTLQLVPNLTPDVSKQPWKLIAELHLYLQKVDD
jgi:hypothetical protein